VAAALGIGARQRPRSSPNSPRNSILKHGGEPGSVEFCHKTRARLRQLLPLPRPTGPSRCRAGRAEGEPAGRAVVSEQMPIAGIQEQICPLGHLDKLTRGGEVLDRPLVVLQHVDLERNSRRPRAAELRGRERSAEASTYSAASESMRSAQIRHYAHRSTRSSFSRGSKPRLRQGPANTPVGCKNPALMLRRVRIRG
jgi:hypothetical protein